MADLGSETGTINVRAQFFDSAIKQIAQQLYKFKQAVTISSTGAWKNFFYRESTDDLTGLTGNATKGIPRGAAFPQSTVTWQRVQTVIEKYGLEDNIFWEDIISNEIDVRNRTMFKLGRGVAKAVDDEIWDTMSEGQTVSATNTLISAKNENGWDSSSAAIIDNIMQAKQNITQANYDVGNLMMFINPLDHRNLIKYLTDKGAQFPSLGTEMAKNGSIGRLLGVNIIVSNSVTTSYALIVVPKIAGTWKEMVPLTTVTKDDPGKSLMIRSYEMGVTQLTDPLAVQLIQTD